LRTEIRSDHHEGATHTKNTHASSLWCEENVRLDASDDQPLSLAERAVASAFLLMTLYLRIETRFFFFFFFLVSRRSRTPRPREGNAQPRASDASTALFVRPSSRTRRGMNNTLSLSDAAETLVGFGGTFLLIPKY
jgi:hypothetical protein